MVVAGMTAFAPTVPAFPIQEPPDAEVGDHVCVVAADGETGVPEYACDVIEVGETEEDVVDELMLSFEGVDSTLIGIDYEGRDYNKDFWCFGTCDTLRWWGDDGPCGPSTSYSTPDMPVTTIDWNDQVSSAQAYGDCDDFIHYEHEDFGGRSLDCGSDCQYMNNNNFEDITSSIKWFD